MGILTESKREEILAAGCPRCGVSPICPTMDAVVGRLCSGCADSRLLALRETAPSLSCIT